MTIFPRTGSGLAIRQPSFCAPSVDYSVCDPFSGTVKLPVEPNPAILDYFRKYRSSGTRPFYAEGNFDNRHYCDVCYSPSPSALWMVETTKDDSTGYFVITRPSETGVRKLILEVASASDSFIVYSLNCLS